MLVYDVTLFIVLGLLVKCQLLFHFARCRRRQVNKFGQLPEVTVFGRQTTTKAFLIAFKTLLKPYSVLFERHTLESRI